MTQDTLATPEQTDTHSAPADRAISGERQIKVLLLLDELAIGGTERQVVELAERLDRSEFEPIIGVFRRTAAQEALTLRTPVVEFESPGPIAIRQLRLLWNLRQFIRREHIDIVVTHLIEATIYGAWAVRSCRRRPKLVTTRRNLYWWIDDRPWQFRCYRHTVKWTDRVLTNSYCAANECRARENVSESQVCTIQNMIDVEQFSNLDRTAARDHLGVSEQEKIVGVLGNWRPVKGLITFLQAAAMVARDHPFTRFLLVGGGPQEGELRQLAEELSLGDRILFVRHPNNPAEMLAAFDIAVQPSRSESFSNVLIEYMAAGKPVVATRVGDAPTVITDQEDGLLVDPDRPDLMAQKISRLIEEPKFAERLVNQARLKVRKNWSADRIVQQYSDFLRGLVE